MGLGLEGDAMEEVQELVYVEQHLLPAPEEVHCLPAGNDTVCCV